MAIQVANSSAQLTGKTLDTLEDNQTITGLKTFNRGAAAPFAVDAASTKVTNLDADKLDGQTGSFYQDAANLNAGQIPSARLPGSFASAQAYHSATQSLSSGAWTSLSLNSEDFDNGSCHDLVTNNSRLTVPASQGGVYILIAFIEFAGAAGGVRGLRFAKNGSNIGPMFWQQELNESTIGNGCSGAIFQSLSAGDYVEVQAFQDTGGALNVLAGARFGFAKII